jgi:hypothetical protein
VCRAKWRTCPLALLLFLLTTRTFPSFLFTFCLLPLSSHPALFCHSHLLYPNPQIKHFLEDSSDDAELSKFVKDFPGSEPYHSAESKTRVARPQILEPRPQSPDLCDDDVEFRGSLWPQPSDSQQYFSAPAPLSPSSRPRSPWGKLDPYDSSEVETPALPLPLSGVGAERPGEGRKRAWGRCVGLCIRCVRGTFLFCISPRSVVSALKALETESNSRD